MPDDPRPFERERGLILRKALKLAVFDGFTPLMLRHAASEAGLDLPVLDAAFPGGALELIEFWSAEADNAAVSALSAEGVSDMKIREKVAHGVEACLDYLRSNKEAARRAAAFVALPHNAPAGLKLGWNTADAIWRALGDKSTDYNFYSKRAILSGVWGATFACWLGDDSEDEQATKAFLAARIENVMQFEKVKAKVRDSGFDPEGMFGWLAKMRYRDPA